MVAAEAPTVTTPASRSPTTGRAAAGAGAGTRRHRHRARAGRRGGVGRWTRLDRAGGDGAPGDRASRGDAAGAVRDEGLKPVLHFIWSDAASDGHVARQSPRGGAKVDDGVKVDLWVSRGSDCTSPRRTSRGRPQVRRKGCWRTAALTYKSRRAASETTPKGNFGPEARRRRDGRAWRHGELLGEQRAAEGGRAGRRRVLAGRRPGHARGRRVRGGAATTSPAASSPATWWARTRWPGRAAAPAMRS